MSTQDPPSADVLDRGVTFRKTRDKVVVTTAAGRFASSTLFVGGFAALGVVVMAKGAFPWFQSVVAGCLLLSIVALFQLVLALGVLALCAYICFAIFREFLTSAKLTASSHGIVLTRSLFGMRRSQRLAWDRVDRIRSKVTGRLSKHGPRIPICSVFGRLDGKDVRLVSSMSQETAEAVARAIEAFH